MLNCIKLIYNFNKFPLILTDKKLSFYKQTFLTFTNIKIMEMDKEMLMKKLSERVDNINKSEEDKIDQNYN